SPPYVAARACEVYEREYAIHYPEEELPAGRPLKVDPIYDRLAARGAVFGARFGWERPLWFSPNGEGRDEYSFRRGNWFEAVGNECHAVRTRVGVLDQTSFAKFTASGPGAERFLDRVLANRLPAEVGRMALTQACRPGGGIECDLTVTRLEENFYLVSAAATEEHDYAWLQAQVRDDDDLRLENVTPRFGVLTLAGPRSRELLQSLTDTDVSQASFPFFRARRLRVGPAPVLALRVSYVGEHGYEPVRANGTPIGYVAAGGYGHTVARSIALAYVPVEHSKPGTALSVDILGEPKPAVVVPQPLYDPGNLRLLS